MPTSFDDTKEECPSCKSKDTELEFNTYEFPMEKSRYCKKCGDKYTNTQSVHKAVKQFDDLPYKNYRGNKKVRTGLAERAREGKKHG